ncbi:MAG TPA: response regulator [Anaerolineales bacterium]
MLEAAPKILIVEDDLDVAEMLNAYFRVQGYEVYTVNWGEDGVRSSQTVSPDLVILDIRLPDIDGYEVARRLREDRRTQDIPIIFLTEKRDRADRLEGLELGANDYITKPFDIQELRLRVRNALKRVSQGSLTNPVSGLPEGGVVDERLGETMEKPGTAFVLVALENMQSFRESYGFVAADDVLRAVSVMILNTLRETGMPEDFLGHVGPAEFVLVTAPGHAAALQEKLRARLEQSLEYFYPIKDRDHLTADKTRLTVSMSQIESAPRRFKDADALKAELLRQKK